MCGSRGRHPWVCRVTRSLDLSSPKCSTRAKARLRSQIYSRLTSDCDSSTLTETLVSMTLQVDVGGRIPTAGCPMCDNALWGAKGIPVRRLSRVQQTNYFWWQSEGRRIIFRESDKPPAFFSFFFFFDTEGIFLSLTFIPICWVQHIYLITVSVLEIPWHVNHTTSRSVYK